MPHTRTKKTVKVEGWAVVENERLMIKWDHAHSVFSPRIYTTAESARNVARRVAEAGGNPDVFKCTIVYQLPTKPNRKK